MLKENTQEQITELFEREKTPDEKAVEDFLTTVTSTALYYKSIREDSITLGDTILENQLSGDQIKILLGKEYLNVGDDEEPLVIDKERETTLPNVTINLTVNGKHEFRVTNIGAYRNYKPSVNPFINKLVDEFKLRESFMERRAQLLSERAKIFSRQWISQAEKYQDLYEKVSNFDIPAIQALYLSTLWNKTITSGSGELNDDLMREITLETARINESEKSLGSDVRMVGCEVEIPYTGYFTSKRVKSARYVFFPEHLELLKDLEIPIETDKQGEAAIPPSRSPEIQYKILDQLTRMGFTPKEESLRYTMHVNISVTEQEMSSFGTDLENDRVAMKAERALPVLGYIVGGRFSSEARLLQGAYSVPLQIKGYSAESFRFEFRALEFDPAESEEDFVSKINAIRKTVSLFTEYFSSERPENTRYGRFLLKLARDTLGTDAGNLTVVEKELSSEIEDIIANKGKREKLKTAFDELVAE